MKNEVQELRDATGRLILLCYIDTDIGMIVLERREKGCCSRVLLPIGTQLEFDPGKKPAKRK